MSDVAFETFGSGGAEPYAHALRCEDDVLYLRDAGSSHAAPSLSMDMSRWSDAADVIDRSLLVGARGAVLDIGCGPGRMVQAAADQGLPALGIDVSRAAIEIATTAGLNVLRRSVFEALPHEGEWDLALLIDGNIGIGGDPRSLLTRTRELLGARGAAIVEVHPDRGRDRAYEGTVIDIRGHRSANFPWAEVGQDALESKARHAGLALVHAWEAGGRSFCRLAAR